MDKSEYISIPRKRSRLPWPYDPLLTQKQQWRLISAGLAVLAIICAGAWWLL